MNAPDMNRPGAALASIEHWIGGRVVPTPGLPFPWEVPSAPNRPPLPGEHTAEVLGEGAAR